MKKKITLLLTVVSMLILLVVPVSANTSDLKVPKQIRVIQDRDKLHISWIKSPLADGHEVLMKTGTSKPWKILKTLPNTKNTYNYRTPLKFGQKYYFTIRPYEKVKGKKVYGSYNKKGTTLTYMKPPVAKVIKISHNSMTISWDKVKGAEHYRIYVQGDGKIRSFNNITGLSKKVGKLNASTQYTIKIAAYQNRNPLYGEDIQQTTAELPVNDMFDIKLHNTGIAEIENKTNTDFGRISFKVNYYDSSGKIVWKDICGFKINNFAKSTTRYAQYLLPTKDVIYSYYRITATVEEANTVINHKLINQLKVEYLSGRYIEVENSSDKFIIFDFEGALFRNGIPIAVSNESNRHINAYARSTYPLYYLPFFDKNYDQRIAQITYAKEN